MGRQTVGGSARAVWPFIEIPLFCPLHHESRRWRLRTVVRVEIPGARPTIMIYEAVNPRFFSAKAVRNSRRFGTLQLSAIRSASPREIVRIRDSSQLARFTSTAHTPFSLT